MHFRPPPILCLPPSDARWRMSRWINCSVDFFSRCHFPGVFLAAVFVQSGVRPQDSSPFQGRVASSKVAVNFRCACLAVVTLPSPPVAAGPRRLPDAHLRRLFIQARQVWRVLLRTRRFVSPSRDNRPLNETASSPFPS